MRTFLIPMIEVLTDVEFFQKLGSTGLIAEGDEDAHGDEDDKKDGESRDGMGSLGFCQPNELIDRQY